MTQQELSYTEEELVGLLKAHDERGLSYLYDRYSNALFQVIYQQVPEQVSAEDLLQQVFLKIWNGIDSFDASKGRLYTWMLNIARNRAIDHTRSKDFNKQSKTASLPENVYKEAGTEASGIRDVGLQRTLEKLPVETRRLIELSYFQGYTQDEISKMLQIPLGTVKTRIRAAILQLRKILNPNTVSGS